jgi:hypothetical protein
MSFNFVIVAVSFQAFRRAGGRHYTRIKQGT